ncbi:MAG: hypothetical protein JW846_00685 [Dehalococcoidia bacterium]|nr:hypothetical protein [Dehalococcoidia bacterium]
MAQDFTFEKYGELLKCMQRNDYRVMTVADYLGDCVTHGHTTVLRHDVDRNVKRAFAMAQLEHSMGVHSTYYFRTTKQVFRPELLREVAAMGHEVGYHYEVLDRAHGNHEEAIHIFEKELAEFKGITDVRTIAMHGNPLTKWDNRDLWKTHSFEDFGLVGEAYLSFQNIVYLSDTGRTWSPRNKVKDWMPATDGTRMPQPDVHSTDDLMRWLGFCSGEEVYLTAHPERWAATGFQWMASCLCDTAANGGKKIVNEKRRLTRQDTHK